MQLPRKLRETDISRLVGEHHHVQHREWWAYRIGWFLMALILLAGLFGIWGQGGISRVDATSPEGNMKVSYERFLRNDAATTVDVMFPPGMAEQGTIRLSINQDYINSHTVDAITPEPESVTVHEEDIVYEFEAHPDSVLTVGLDLHPDMSGGMGTLDARFQGDSAGKVQFGQLVYP